MNKLFQRFLTKSSIRRPIVRRRMRLHVEALQERALPSVTAFVNPAHQLIIKGDNNANNVTVSLANTSIHVAAGGKSFDFDNLNGNVAQIIFSGLGGNDAFTNNTDIACVAKGGDGNDRLTGGTANDRLNGGAGNDIEHGGGGDDVLLGAGGNDRLFGDDGNDSITGGDGNDREFGGAGADSLVGGAGDDVIHGDAGNDFEHGGQGSDVLNGDDDNDVLIGAAGNDVEHGGVGDDYLTGDAGNDHLFGDDGNDSEHGGAGNDDLAGDAGDDDLSGDVGNDHLNGGVGADHLHGGAGFDDAVGDDSDVQTEIERNDLGAPLTGSTAALGFAEFYTVLHDGANFKVEVEHARANQSFDVFVGGAKVGTLTTSPEGEGKLKLILTSVDVKAGATVTVKDSLGVVLVEGTFGQSQDDHGN